MSTDKPNVEHNPGQSRFEIKTQGYTAVLDYVLDGSKITFTHTDVPPALEGQGIGSLLARTGLEYAKEHSLNIRATCWFVQGYLRRHPEYETDLRS